MREGVVSMTMIPVQCTGYPASHDNTSPSREREVREGVVSMTMIPVQCTGYPASHDNTSPSYK